MEYRLVTSIVFNSSASLEGEWLRSLDEQIARLLYQLVPDIHTKCTVITAPERPA